MRDTDLEDSILSFLKKIPKKRYASAREIALGISGGQYPSANEERYIQKICLQLWEHHIVDNKRLSPQNCYRLRQKRFDFAGRTALKRKYKAEAVTLLKNKDWMPRISVVEELAGPVVERRERRISVAQGAISALIKQGIIKAKYTKIYAEIRLAAE